MLRERLTCSRLFHEMDFENPETPNCKSSTGSHCDKHAYLQGERQTAFNIPGCTDLQMDFIGKNLEKSV